MPKIEIEAVPLETGCSCPAPFDPIYLEAGPASRGSTRATIPTRHDRLGGFARI